MMRLQELSSSIFALIPRRQMLNRIIFITNMNKSEIISLKLHTFHNLMEQSNHKIMRQKFMKYFEHCSIYYIVYI